MVPGGGLEPPQPCGLRILSPLRLPISPSGLVLKSWYQRVRSSQPRGLPPGSQCAGHHSVAVHAKRAQVIQVALAAAFYHRHNVIRIPQALTIEPRQTPESQQPLPPRASRFAQQPVRLQCVDRTPRTDTSVAQQNLLAQVTRAGPHAPGVHAGSRAESSPAFRDLQRAPAAQCPTLSAARQRRKIGAAARHSSTGAALCQFAHASVIKQRRATVEYLISFIHLLKI
jgi:hypothetical protein